MRFSARILAAVAASTGSVAIWAYAGILSFRAGCAGDTKGASVGDVELAFALENQSAQIFFAGLAVAAAGLLLLPRTTIPTRIAFAAPALVLAVPIFNLLFIQIEIWGVQHCW
ncbi:MAG: hypothetical protein HYU58_15595 [Proteobacteria bacterium]|nr:hypothetical protein [Pseudomonadota bacterium]